MHPLYLDFVDKVWIPEHAERYFSDRDPAALPYLPALLPPATSVPSISRQPRRIKKAS